MDEAKEDLKVPEVLYADIFDRGDYLQLERTAWSDGAITYRARKRSTKFTSWGDWYDSDLHGWPSN